MKNDCVRQCVASITGIPLSKVPHFVKKAEEKKVRWTFLLAKWLKRRGFVFIWTSSDTVTSCSYAKLLVCGTSMRGTQHAVVGVLKNKIDAGVECVNLKIVYDPSKIGLRTISNYGFIIKESK